MTFEFKKKMLSLISILNTIICIIYLGKNLILKSGIDLILWDCVYVFLAIVPFIYINFDKKIKHLFWLVFFFSLLSYFLSNVLVFSLGLIGIVFSFIPSRKEKGVLENLIKSHPLIWSMIIILAGVSFLSSSSIFIYLSKLTYGFDMLGELIATIFLFFMIKLCNKGYLIYINKGSIMEAILVSFPFIFYIFYICCGMFSMYLIEGYKFVSFDNIIVIIFLYMLVGIFEDFLIRGLCLNILLEKYGKTRKGIFLSVVLSSLFFGLIHFINLLTGASFQGVLIQVISATCIGIYFSAIYLRSGSVWVPALLHGVYDVVVSIPSLFMIREILSTREEYGEIISNYSWSNLIFVSVFVFLALFLLRKKKMKHVIDMVNGTENKKNHNKTLQFFLIFIGIGFTYLTCYSMTFSIFQLKDYAYNFYNKILISHDYQKQYSLTYSNRYVNYDSISDEVKLILAVNNLSFDDFVDNYSIKEAEKEVGLNPLSVYIKKDKIDKSIEEIFNKKSDIKYIDFNYSNKTSCNFDEENSMYKCIVINNKDISNLKVYSNINKISLRGDSTVEVYVYYVVEDLENNNLYLDSDLKTIYKHNTSISDIVGSIEYDKNDKENKEFWEEFKKKNNGLIPEYKLSLELSDSGQYLYFVSSEFVEGSIDNK